MDAGGIWQEQGGGGEMRFPWDLFEGKTLVKRLQFSLKHLCPVVTKRRSLLVEEEAQLDT